MLENVAYFIIGVAILIKGSDWIVDGAKALARRFSLPQMFVGLTITSVGTSIPEIATSMFAAWNGASGIAIGNIVGSCFVQITLILGVVGLVREMDVERTAVHRDGPFMILAMLILAVTMADRVVSRMEGIVLVLIYVGYLLGLFLWGRTPDKEEEDEELASTWWLVPGLVAVPIGANLFVKSAMAIAQYFSVSETLIGLTLVSVGTSLPELTVSVMALRRGATALSVGNLIGSNITDPLLSLGSCAAIRDLTVEHGILEFNIPLTLLAYVLAICYFHTEHRLTRRESMALVIVYILFLVVNVLEARIPAA